MLISKNKLFIFLLFFLGIILRLVFVEKQTLWMDEASVYLESFERSLAETWSIRHRLQPQNAPLFPLMIAGLHSLLKSNEFIFYRYFSALIGILSLFSVYHFSKLYFRDQKKTLLFFSLIVFSSFHVQFSQLIRFYILLFLCFYTHLYLSFKWFEGNQKTSLLLIFIISSVGCWTNQLMALSFLVSSLFYIQKYGFKFRKLFIFNSINILGFLSSLPSYILYMNGKFKIGSYRELSWGDLAYMIKTVFIPKHLGLSLLDLRQLQHNKYDIKLLLENITNVVFLEIALMFIVVGLWIFYLKKIRFLKINYLVFIFSLMFFSIFLFYKNVPLNSRYFFIFMPLSLLVFVDNLVLFGKYKNIAFSFLLFINIFSMGNYYFSTKHHTLNVDKIYSLLSNGNNYVSLESSRFFISYFNKKYKNKDVSIVENLVNRKKYIQFLPDFFKQKEKFTFVYTHRSVLTLDNLDFIFNDLSKTHIIEEAHKSIDPYFKFYKFSRK